MVSRFVQEAGLIQKDPAKFTPLKTSEYANIARERPNTMPNTIKSNLSKDISKFNVGSAVVHARYGEGVIVAMDGNTATILFAKLEESSVGIAQKILNLNKNLFL